MHILGAAVVGAVVGIALLAVGAFIASEHFDTNLIGI
jgi:hypothetical protein